MKQIEALCKAYLKFYQKEREKWDVLNISYKNLKLPKEVIEHFDKSYQHPFNMLHEAIKHYLKERGTSQKIDSVKLTIAFLCSIEGAMQSYRKRFFDFVERKPTLDELIDWHVSNFEKTLSALNPLKPPT